jgi:hypothetical protein
LCLAELAEREASPTFALATAAIQTKSLPSLSLSHRIALHCRCTSLYYPTILLRACCVVSCIRRCHCIAYCLYSHVHLPPALGFFRRRLTVCALTRDRMKVSCSPHAAICARAVVSPWLFRRAVAYIVPPAGRASAVCRRCPLVLPVPRSARCCCPSTVVAQVSLLLSLSRRAVVRCRCVLCS